MYEEEILLGQFPKDFVWGAATAAYQIEVDVEKLRKHSFRLTLQNTMGEGGLYAPPTLALCLLLKIS